MLERTHFSELSISKFPTLKRQTRLQSQKSKLNDRVVINPTQNPSTYTVVLFQFCYQFNPPHETDAKSKFAFKISSLDVANDLYTFTTIVNQPGNPASFAK